MTHGAVLQNETGLPCWNRPLLIGTTIKFFVKKSRKKEVVFFNLWEHVFFRRAVFRIIIYK